MSIVTSRSTILKNYDPSSRQKAKRQSTNRVRFEFLNEQNLRRILENTTSTDVAIKTEALKAYEQYFLLVHDPEISSKDFLRIIEDSRQCIDLFTQKCTKLIEAILSMQWTQREGDIIDEYQKFLIDLLSAHTRYVRFAIERLIDQWLPTDADREQWKRGEPSDGVRVKMRYVHDVIAAILEVIPMSQIILIEIIHKKFPYFMCSTHIVVGYVTNVFWLMDYRPIFKEDLLQLLLKKLVVLDANVPRSVIENSEYEDQNENFDEIFTMEDVGGDVKNYEIDEMRNEQAETLDICMEKILAFIETEYQQSVQQNQCAILFNTLLKQFDNIILPTHNIHHVQYFIFYLCSFKVSYAEQFVQFCWQKIGNPNTAPTVRQSLVNYVASFLARARYIPIGLIKECLHDMCEWIQDYIRRCENGNNVNVLRAHLVFYSICQAIFYVIAFRSRDLTNSLKNLQFLASLQLSAIVNCHLNPLRVCRPEIATAFAGVTRAHQLAYCHAVLERNARRKLALVYRNETTMPEDSLDTYFPFDPYYLKKSLKRIEQLYQEYQTCDDENDSSTATVAAPNVAAGGTTTTTAAAAATVTNSRKRMEPTRTGTETQNIYPTGASIEEIDDFITDKRLKISLSQSFERELHLNNL